MANLVCEVLVTEAPLPARGAETDPNAGAVVEFSGVVRELEEDRVIDGIDYEANSPMAEHQLQSIADAAAEKFQLQGVVAHHRIGFVPVGEASLYLQVQAGHRAAAFEAAKWIVDELKKRVPIWKRPRFKTGNQPAEKSRSQPPATVT